MKRVTKNNLLKLVSLMKEYEARKEPQVLQEVNTFIEEVINKDAKYFSKLQSYDFDNDTLRYLL